MGAGASAQQAALPEDMAEWDVENVFDGQISRPKQNLAEKNRRQTNNLADSMDAKSMICNLSWENIEESGNAFEKTMQWQGLNFLAFETYFRLKQCPSCKQCND